MAVALTPFTDYSFSLDILYSYNLYGFLDVYVSIITDIC